MTRKPRPSRLNLPRLVEYYLSHTIRRRVISTECWELPEGFRYSNSEGRVRIGIGRKVLSLSRLVLEWMIQRPIREGFQANHHCDNSACIRPDHLYEGTPKDNAGDRSRRGRYTVGSSRNVYSDEQIEEVRKLRAAGLTTRRIAAQTGMSAGYVSEVTRGLRRWLT